MTLTDDEHKVARIIADLDRRISDLEEQSRSAPTPNLLVNVSDELHVADSVSAIHEMTMEEGRWNQTGWRTSSWSAYERDDT